MTTRRGRWSTRRTSVVVLVTAAALGVGGCTVPPPSPSPPTTPDTTGVPDDLLPYYGQVPEWSECGTGLDCTTVTAPLDWSDPSRASIDLAVSRHRATGGDPQGSIVVNPGGPGLSGVEAVRSGFADLFGVALIEDVDLVGVDPRGVGRSSAVECLDDDDLDDFLFAPYDAPRGSSAWAGEVEERNERFAAACEANSDGLLGYISTVEAARDLDLVRAVLGGETLDYLGFSYGTVLGATYAELFPERVGRFVLDGAIDPGESPAETARAGLTAFDAALTAYLAECVADAGCPFTGTVDDARAQLADLLVSLDDAPARASDGRQLDATGMLQAVQASLYSDRLWRGLTRAIVEASAGRGGTAFQIVDGYFLRDGGRYPSNWIDSGAAYRCRDTQPLTPAEQAEYAAAIETLAPILAPYYLDAPDVCAVWPAPRAPQIVIDGAGAPPILVIGTTNDPVTPYAGAVSLADTLASGVLVTYEGEGHTAYPRAGPCLADVVETFFLAGTVPADGVVCR